MNTPHRPPGEPVNRPVIELEDVVKRFGDVEAVDHVSLRIGQGEFFSLLGPSGCGKTTTLRMLAGFDSPTSGRILLDGADVTRVPANKRDVNMVFQNYALFPHLDVAANVAYGLRREKLPTTEIEERVTDVLELVDLPRQDFGNRRPTQLSGGQQQRVALARALVKRPKALLLDEPLGALDLKLRRGMQLELKAMQHELGITFIYVTHDQEEALTMSDRIAVMDGGRIVQVDEAREIYEHPRTRFVADFIGVSNIIELPVVSREGDLVALATPVDGSVAVSNQEVEERGRIAFSIRPEHIEVLPPGVRPDGPCFLEGRVRSSAYLGSEVQYQVEVADIGEILASSPASRTSRKPGEHVVLRWDVEAAIVLGDDA